MLMVSSGWTSLFPDIMILVNATSFQRDCDPQVCRQKSECNINERKYERILTINKKKMKRIFIIAR